jgi:hypothetical protein
MNCQDIAGILDDGDSQSLSAAERRAVEAHVAGCAECRAAFAAHDAMVSMVLPAMSPDLAAQCRRLVVAQSVGGGRRVGGRPLFVVGVLLAGAAAAALVGLNVIGGAGGGSVLPELAVTTPDSGGNANGSSAMPLPESDEAIAEPAEPAVNAPDATGFTVGVSPLLQNSTNPEVIRISETVYRAFLDELRRIPNIELVMLPAGEFQATAITAGSAILIEGGVAASTAPFQTPASEATTVAGPPVDVIEFEAATVASIRNLSDPVSAGTTAEGARTLVLVDSSRVVSSNGNGTVDMNTIPTALAGRIETITGGASATYGSDFLDNNIAGIRVDRRFSWTGDGDGFMITPQPLPYDVVLEAAASSRSGSNVWSFVVNARSRSSGALSTSLGSEIGVPMDPSAFVKQLIETLQAEVFPVDEKSLAAVTANVLDRRLSVDEWLAELNRLKQMTGRAGNTRLSDDVALAIVDMGSRISDPRQLISYLQALEGLENAVLVQPLGQALRNGESENIRLEAAILLANFRQDPMARAALDGAANADPSPAVRLSARWAALDEAGQRNLIVTSLLDTRLTDAERIEPLLLDVRWARTAPVELGPAVDATVANELGTLLRRHEPAETRARVLGRLSRERSQNLTPLFVERLRDDEAEVVRTAAASALGQRLDEPAARQALERAAMSDPSPVVRQAALRWLEGPVAQSEVLIRN